MTSESSVAPSVLFIGDDWYGSNATSLRDGLIAAGTPVTTIDTGRLLSHTMSMPRRLAKRIASGAYEDVARRSLTRAVEKTVKTKGPFDVLVVFKGLLVEHDVVNSFAGTTVHYHPDDVSNAENTSPTYLEAEAAYDLHITTKRHNVHELSARAGVPVQFMRCAYDHRWHRDDATPASGGMRLGFVGTKRPDRTAFIRNLAEEEARAGRKMLLAGSGWASEMNMDGLAELYGPQFGTNFSAIVHRARLQLGVLNSANRDTHTCRTFEVPAAGGLFIGEATDEHREIFGAGSSALLYEDDGEALDMIRFARSNPESAESIRRRGHQIVTAGHNSYVDRAQSILKLVTEGYER